MSWYKKRSMEISADRQHRRIAQLESKLTNAMLKAEERHKEFLKTYELFDKSAREEVRLSAELAEYERRISSGELVPVDVAEEWFGKAILSTAKIEEQPPRLKQFAAEQANKGR